MSARDNVYFNTNVGDLVVTMKTNGDFIISHTHISDCGECGIRVTAPEFAYMMELFKDRKRE